jgi:amino acid adenylation domain-containing protein
MADLSSDKKRALLARLLQRKAQQLPTAVPLSYGQQAMWLTAQLAPESWAYHVLFSAYIRSAVAIPALRQALQTLLERHAALRTTYTVQDGTLVQHIQAHPQVPFEVVDASAWSEQALYDRLLEAVRSPFDLAQGPLMRVGLYSRSPSDHVLVLTIHHIAIDFYSLGVMLEELRALYQAETTGVPITLPALEAQYTDYARWQAEVLAGPVGDELWEYWQQQLAGELPTLHLPTDRPRPPRQTYNGASHIFSLPEALTQQLKALAQAEGVTLYMLLLAAFQVLLHRYTAQDDLLVGTFMGDRMRPEFRRLVGYMVNPVVLRADLSGNPPFTTFLKQARQTVLEALKHQDFPFPLLVERLRPQRDARQASLFQVAFILQQLSKQEELLACFIPGMTGGQVDFGGLVLEPFALPQQEGQFDLTLEMGEVGASLWGGLKYNTDLFEAATMARLAGHLQTLLAGIVAHPDQSLAALPLMTAEEHQQVVVAWNSTATDYLLEPGLHERFELQVERTPEAIAVVSEDTQISYRELNQRANQLAHHLRSLGVGAEVLVGLCLERSLDMVVGLCGILKAGGAYVPLDPTYPPERLGWMLHDAQVPVLLTHARLLPRLPAHGATVLCLDTDWPTIAAQSTENPQHCTTPENIAYVIYTSGSTGTPKGAMISHRGICNRLLWMQEAYGLTAVDRVLQKTPFSFDVSVWEFFWPLLTGACLVMARPEGHRDSAYLVALIVAQQITTLHFVPSMLHVFLQEPGVEQCDSLRLVICSGEALPFELQERFFTRLGAELHNLYGPTEASVDVSFWACQRQSGRQSVPIGQPIANTQLYVLDAHLQPVPIGVPGELHIGGIGLARGYLNRPELTAEKFIANPFSPVPGARLYKTGDLARYLADGTIEFLGRLDHQVKLHGFRIELDEIAAVLLQHAAVQEAVVLARTDTPGHQTLVAYVVLGQERTAPSPPLRQFLADKLPPYMVPSAFVPLPAMPLTPNGKLDRQALPAPHHSRSISDSPFGVPQTPVEAELARIWAQVLDVEQVGTHDNFFALGGDSIRSIQVRAQAEAAGLSFPLQHLMQYQTVHELAQAVATVSAQALPLPHTTPFSLLTPQDRQRLPATVEDAYPLATLQAGMLFHSQWNTDTATYHDVFSFHLQLPYDVAAFTQALQRLVARHPILRTSFDLGSYSEPLQLVHQQVYVPVQVEDLRNCPQALQEQVLAAWKATEKTQHFDWRTAPLLRVFLHRRSDVSWQLTLSFHHAILDGWSVASLLSEILDTYLAIVRQEPEVLQPPLATCYRDFIALERHTLQTPAAVQYWQQQLADHVVTLLPSRSASDTTAGQHDTAVISLSIPATRCERLYELARAAQVPIRSVLLAAHFRVMSLLSGHTDVLTGVVSNGRLETTDGERVLGLFLNTVPCRLHVSGGTWSDLIRQSFAVEQGYVPYRRYPLAALQRQHGGQPLFQAVFDYTHFHVYRQLAAQDAFSVLQADIFEQTNFPLYVRFSQDVSSPTLTLALHYDTCQFSAEQMSAIREYYDAALRHMVSDPSAPYDSVCLLSAAEQQQLLLEWNDTQRAYPQEQCIHQLFEAQAARAPDAVAVVWEDAFLTYGELNRRANQLAHYLQSLGVGPEVLVGLSVERSIEMMVGLLGILKAGGAYVPLDPAYPKERLAFMVHDARLPVLLTQAHLMAEFPAHSARVVRLDADWHDIARQGEENPQSGTTPDNIAYVIYTSGSTGRPKGVLGLHRGAVNRFAWMWAAYPFHADEVGCQKTSLNFVDSVWEIFGPLLQGIRVVIIPTPVLQEPYRLVQALATHQVTRLVLVPSLLKVLLDTCEALHHPLPQLRLWISSGEPLSVALYERFHKCLPGSTLLNLYGSSEVAADVTWYDTRQMPAACSSVPLGRPIANTQIYLLDAHLQPVPVGVPGEIYVGGDGLARGYLYRPELTSERFLPHPFRTGPGARVYKTGDLARYLPDGTIEFLGRTDHQVKIRGYRIEPGEIEASLGRHPGVQETVVMAREDTIGEKRLVAYVVARPGSTLSPLELRSFLQQQMPEYMVPAALELLEALPLTPNGKVDRLALPVPAPISPTSAAGVVAPRTTTEATLAALWSQVLGVERLGVHDNFFALGGHSILAMRLLGLIRQTFAQELPLSVLLQAPTIADLAGFLADRTRTSCRFLVPIQARGTKRPLFCLHPAGGQVMVYQPLAACLGPDRPLYGLQSQDLTEEPGIHRSLEAMAVDYATAIRACQSDGPYALLGWSLGGVLAMAVARALEIQGQRVVFVGLLDTYLPAHDQLSWGQDTMHGLVLGLGGRMASALATLDPLSQQTLHDALRVLPPTERLQRLVSWGQERHLLAPDLPLDQLHQQVALAEAHVSMLRAHTVATMQAPLYIWWAKEHLPEGPQRPNWQQYTSGPVQTAIVAGNHFSMVQLPHVQELAAQIQACLQTIEEGHQSC